MNQTDLIGFTGVAILLVAYFLNLTNKLHKDGFGYLFLNFAGAAIACFASALLHYLPFIILEGCWTMVSLIGLLAMLKKKRKVEND